MFARTHMGSDRQPKGNMENTAFIDETTRPR